MTLRQYWNGIIKYWKLIVICCLLVGVGASIGTRLVTPLYQSTALVEVFAGSAGSEVNYTTLQASDGFVQTEATLATSDPVLQEVASHYTGLTATQLAGKVTASPKLNTQIFSITVLDPNSVRAAALANDIARTLITQQLQLDINEYGSAQSKIIIVQTAQPALRPAQPNVLLNTLAGLLTGLVLGLLLVALLEQVDPRVRTLETLKNWLNWPMLASISRAHPDEEAFQPTDDSEAAESYRMLRTQIGLVMREKHLQRLLITSAFPEEGKSTIAANLAIFMAKAGHPTLLIDANLRHPTLHALFHVRENTPGLSDAVQAFNISTTSNVSIGQPPSSSRMQQPFSAELPLTPAPAMLTTGGIAPSPVSLNAFIHQLAIPHLWLMPVGTQLSNPSEILDSQSMQDLLDTVAQCGIAFIIFDTPALLGLSDTTILAAKVDSALVVVDLAHAKKASLKQLKEQLAQVNTHIIGCVINKRQHHSIQLPYTSQIHNRKEMHQVGRQTISEQLPSTLKENSLSDLEITRKQYTVRFPSISEESSQGITEEQVMSSNGYMQAMVSDSQEDAPDRINHTTDVGSSYNSNMRGRMI